MASLSDELVLYIKESLQWIDTKWNDSPAKRNGLNYYGITIFNKEGILKLCKIIKAWENLFENAPKKFTLSTEYNLELEDFKYIELERENIINALKCLIDLCETAIREDKNIIHFGV